MKTTCPWKGRLRIKSNNKLAIARPILSATKMRFRSLVVSWCVCAIHGSVQIASGHRSADATTRSAYHPPSDNGIPLARSPRSIPSLPPVPAVPLLPVPLRPGSPARHAADAISKPAAVPGILSKKIRHKRSLRRTTANREKIGEPLAKRGSRRKRRKKCRCQKFGRRSLGTLLRETPELHGSFIIKSRSAGAVNSPKPMSELTAETSTHFTDIAFTTADVVRSTLFDDAKTIPKAAKLADDAIREKHQRDSPRERCNGIRCVTKNCKKKEKKKSVIDLLDQEFFPDVGAARAETSSRSLKNMNFQSIAE